MASFVKLPADSPIMLFVFPLNPVIGGQWHVLLCLKQDFFTEIFACMVVSTATNATVRHDSYTRASLDSRCLQLAWPLACMHMHDDVQRVTRPASYVHAPDTQLCAI